VGGVVGRRLGGRLAAFELEAGLEVERRQDLGDREVDRGVAVRGERLALLADLGRLDLDRVGRLLDRAPATRARGRRLRTGRAAPAPGSPTGSTSLSHRTSSFAFLPASTARAPGARARPRRLTLAPRTPAARRQAKATWARSPARRLGSSAPQGAGWSRAGAARPAPFVGDA